MRYAMLINLKRCTGCNTCTIACKVQNGTPPEVFFNRVLVWENGVYPNVRLHHQPVLCNQCEQAACVAVCPTGASYKDVDGVVRINKDKCIGCKSCIVACPYNARTFISSKPQTYFPEVGQTEFEKVKYAAFEKGTVVKCDFCSGRVAEGKKPACVQSCIEKARFFGDLDDPDDYVARMVANGTAQPLHPEFGTEPSVYYIAE